MAKLGVFIEHPEYFRNYLQTGALLTLSKNHDVELIIDLRFTESNVQFDNFKSIRFFDFSQKKSTRVQFLFNVYMFRFRKVSKSFEYRLIRTRPRLNYIFSEVKKAKSSFLGSPSMTKTESEWSGKNYLLSENHASYKLENKVFTQFRRFSKLFFKSSPSFLIGIADKYARYWCAWFLGKPIVFYFFIKLVKTRQIISQDLLNLVTDLDLELLVIPSAAYESTTVDLINMGKKLGIPSALVIDNWDNLSSKSILWTKPDYVFTWGPQSSRHAVDIQKMNEDCVMDLGSARFTDYFANGQTFSDHLPENYVLFCGTFLVFDEIQVLQILENEISSHPETYNGLKIVYRPHPAGQNLRDFNSDLFKHVVLDPQFKKVDSQGSKIPNLDWDKLTLQYIPELISNAQFLVGGMTSMLIEGSLFHKKYLGLVHHEPKNITSPRTVYNSYIHFDEVKALPNFVPCFDLSNFAEVFRETFSEPREMNAHSIDVALSDFIVLETNSFGTRLNTLIDKILATRNLS